MKGRGGPAARAPANRKGGSSNDAPLGSRVSGPSPSPPFPSPHRMGRGGMKIGGGLLSTNRRRQATPYPNPYRSSKVIHRRRGELWDLSPQPTVNNFGATRISMCEQIQFCPRTGRHAELGRRITPPLSKDEWGETFAPSSALWTETNSQRSPFRRPSIRPSPVQSPA
jgi:hypothetical protein